MSDANLLKKGNEARFLFQMLLFVAVKLVIHCKTGLARPVQQLVQM